jgi:L-malate glycosyltransferase
MKVLIVGQCFVSAINGEICIPGGTERYVYGLAKQLQIDNYEVAVLSTTKDKKEVGWEILNEINVYKMYVPSKFYSLLADLYLFLISLKIIRDFNPAIVHTISPFYKFSPGAIAAAKFFKKKTVYTRTTFPHEQGRHFLSIFLDNFVFSNMLKHADVTIVLSEQMKMAMSKKFSRLEIIPSFITKSYYKNAFKNSCSILYVGRLDKFKGVDILIKSIFYVKNKIPLIKLHIVGSGECLNYLTNLIRLYNLEENVIFEGHLNDSELSDIYPQSDIFVFPSFKEGLPMALIEAMSAGLPIIASDIEPCIELLEMGKYGILVKKGDSKALADAICTLMADDSLKNHYSKLCLEKSTQYLQKTIVKRIEYLYNSLELTQ